jgi:division/cell wall cluster transcriptional repressor MraZ
MIDQESTDVSFYGKSCNRLNSKNQVAIPKRFRAIVPEETLKRGFVLIKGEAQCLYMYTYQMFKLVKNRVRSLAEETNDPEFFRCFMESAHQICLDSQSRFILPADMEKAAGLKGKDILFIGNDDRIEIWEPTLRKDDPKSKTDNEELRKKHARRIFGL